MMPENPFEAAREKVKKTLEEVRVGMREKLGVTDETKRFERARKRLAKRIFTPKVEE